MIRDKYLKLLFIPVLGILIPLLSRIIHYENYSTAEIVAANLFFIFTSFCIWAGCNWVHGKMRPFFNPQTNPFIKIATISFTSALYGSAIGGLLAFLWIRFSREVFTWIALNKFIVLSSFAVILFTLVYEILFLTKERELDNKIVDQLDFERSQAEMALLRNELDPHFIFNSLNTLSSLIPVDNEKAIAFNTKLAKVYRYFLINKERDLISLEDELDFITNYFYLLQIRHDNKIRLVTELHSSHEKPIMILPYALQVLVENAVKHNDYSEENPLEIKIMLNGQYIRISNALRPKPYLINSTGIGIRNLAARYKHVCNKDIIVEKNAEQFTVSIPLIQQPLNI